MHPNRILLLPFAFGWLAAASLNAAELVHAKDGSGVYGYKDTPKLPWCDYLVHDPDRPAPPRVNPGPARPPAPPPGDAIVLFDGNDVSRWQPSQWRIVDGCLESPKTGNLVTRDEFGSFQLHLEWRQPKNFEGPWYDRGNNGVLLHGLYEIQIFDSYNEKLYPDGQAAAIYGQTPPMVNVCRPPGEWETFDIIFLAPVFADGRLTQPARVTMFHNGVLVHLHEVVHGATNHRVLPNYNRQITRGPIAFGAHGCPVQFRNIWLRPLDPDQMSKR